MSSVKMAAILSGGGGGGGFLMEIMGQTDHLVDYQFIPRLRY